MNIDKYMKKAYGFMAKTEKEQKKKAEELNKIIKKFEEAKKRLEIEYAAEISNKTRKNLQRERKVVKKLIRKAQERYDQLIGSNN